MIWDEEVPMPWTHYEGSERTIGAHADADLCMVDAGLAPGGAYGRLALETAPGSMPFDIPPNVTRIVVFRARGHEVDSERFCVEISWNGKFAQAEPQMAEHLSVRGPVSDPSPQAD